AEAAADHQAERAANGPQNLHLAGPALEVVAEDERYLAEDHVHAAQLEQDVHHALETLLVDEVLAVLLERQPEDVAALSPAAAGVVTDALDREDELEQEPRPQAEQVAVERHAADVRARLVARGDDDVVALLNQARHRADQAGCVRVVGVHGDDEVLVAAQL